MDRQNSTDFCMCMCLFDRAPIAPVFLAGGKTTPTPEYTLPGVCKQEIPPRFLPPPPPPPLPDWTIAKCLEIELEKKSRGKTFASQGKWLILESKVKLLVLYRQPWCSKEAQHSIVYISSRKKHVDGIGPKPAARDDETAVRRTSKESERNAVHDSSAADRKPHDAVGKLSARYVMAIIVAYAK